MFASSVSNVPYLVSNNGQFHIRFKTNGFGNNARGFNISWSRKYLCSVLSNVFQFKKVSNKNDIKIHVAKAAQTRTHKNINKKCPVKFYS